MTLAYRIGRRGWTLVAAATVALASCRSAPSVSQGTPGPAGYSGPQQDGVARGSITNLGSTNWMMP